MFLGDYIDRGPASCQTIDMLIDRSRRHECVFLKGNHEALLLEVLAGGGGLEAWKHYGGFQTLISYGIAPPMKPDPSEQRRLVGELAEKIPDSHRRFFDNLRPSYSCGDFFFSHAGVRPGVSLERQREEDLLWIRDEFLESERDFGKFVVHGHTPVPSPIFARIGSISIREAMQRAFSPYSSSRANECLRSKLRFGANGRSGTGRKSNKI